MQSVLQTLQHTAFVTSTATAKLTATSSGEVAEQTVLWRHILQELKELNHTQKRILEVLQDNNPRPTKVARPRKSTASVDDESSLSAGVDSHNNKVVLEPLLSELPTFTVVATNIWSRWYKRIQQASEKVAVDQVVSTTATVTNYQKQFYDRMQKAHQTYKGMDTSTIMARVMLGEMPVSDEDPRTMCNLVLHDTQFPIRWKTHNRALILWCWQHEQQKWTPMITTKEVVEEVWQTFGKHLWVVMQSYWMWYVKVCCYTNLFMASHGVSRDDLYKSMIEMMGGYDSMTDISIHIQKLGRTWHDMLKNKSL